MDAKALGQFIPLILIFVIFYFLLIRPQQKRIKEHKAMVNALNRGDQVITAGGLVGKIERLLDDEKVEKAISDLEQVGLIKFIGRNNALIVVVDFVRENVFPKMKGNKTFKNVWLGNGWLSKDKDGKVTFTATRNLPY